MNMMVIQHILNNIRSNTKTLTIQIDNPLEDMQIEKRTDHDMYALLKQTNELLTEKKNCTFTENDSTIINFIYTYIDYTEKPQEYCGIMVSSTILPKFDYKYI